MKRRRFLQTLALAPALPLAAKLPVLAAPAKALWFVDWSDIVLPRTVTCYSPEYLKALEGIFGCDPHAMDKFLNGFKCSKP